MCNFRLFARLIWQRSVCHSVFFSGLDINSRRQAKQAVKVDVLQFCVSAGLRGSDLFHNFSLT